MPKAASIRLFFGIDPGANGGMAVLGAGGGIISSIKMPQTERDVWDWINESWTSTPVAMIERVHSMPAQGIASAFTFGKGYGGLRMALIAASIPFEEVNPEKWVKGLGIPKRGKTESKTTWKNRLKARAQQLFPEAEVTLKTSDALLIAEYCRRYHLGILASTKK